MSLNLLFDNLLTIKIAGATIFVAWGWYGASIIIYRLIIGN